MLVRRRRVNAQRFLKTSVEVLEAGRGGDSDVGCGSVGASDLNDEAAESGRVPEEVVSCSCAMVRSFHWLICWT